jgi:HEAT repeat protein
MGSRKRLIIRVGGIRPRVGLVRPILWIALVAAGCTPYLGSTYLSFLRHARSNPDPNLRYLAISKLGSESLYDNDLEKKEVVDFLLERYRSGRDPLAVRVMMVRTLGNLRDKRAREIVLQAAQNSDPMLRLEGCRALGKVGVEEDALLLSRIMATDTLEDCRVASIEALGELKPKDPRILVVLLNGMENDDPAIRYECLNALRSITGKDYGVLVENWKKGLEPEIAAAAQAAQAAAVPRLAADASLSKPGPFAAIASAASKARSAAAARARANPNPRYDVHAADPNSP